MTLADQGKPEPIKILPLEGLPEVKPGDNLGEMLAGSLDESVWQEGDVLVVAQKVVSKAEGARVSLDSITPSPLALRWAEAWERDARMVELVFRESARIVRMERGLIISETRHGYVCANAGIDLSNSGEGEVAVLLPKDPDKSAGEIHETFRRITGKALGVIVADTFGRPWRTGLTQVALGVAHLAPCLDLRGQNDGDGRPLGSTVLAMADMLACAAELVCPKNGRIPAALIQGYKNQGDFDTGKALVRPPELDLFR